MVLRGELGFLEISQRVVRGHGAGQCLVSVRTTDAAQEGSTIDESLQLCVDEVLDGRILWIVTDVPLENGFTRDLGNEWAAFACAVWQALRGYVSNLSV